MRCGHAHMTRTRQHVHGSVCCAHMVRRLGKLVQASDTCALRARCDVSGYHGLPPADECNVLFLTALAQRCSDHDVGRIVSLPYPISHCDPCHNKRYITFLGMLLPARTFRSVHAAAVANAATPSTCLFLLSMHSIMNSSP